MHLSVHLVPTDGPRDPGAVAEAIEAYFVARSVTADRITFSQYGVKTHVAKPGKLVKLARDLRTRSMTMWRFPTKENRAGTDIAAYLRPTDVNDQQYTTRAITVVWTPGLAAVDTPLRTFLSSMAARYPLAQGSVSCFDLQVEAAFEAFRGAVVHGTAPPSNDALVHEDALCRSFFHQKLRRLYPVTIIGPEIWAALPPMPRFDPMPTIEDLGDCKVLTAWPTLCDPRAPAFLRTNRALRAWLWPFTIQNPADHVDRDPA